MRFALAASLFFTLISCVAEQPDTPPERKNTPVLAPKHQVIYYSLEPG